MDPKTLSAVPTPSSAPDVRTRSAQESLPVNDVAVVIGYMNKNGKREEIVHHVDGSAVQIALCEHKVEEKYQKCKAEDGALIGYEPTGEVTLTLRVKYFKAI